MSSSYKFYFTASVIVGMLLLPLITLGIVSAVILQAAEGNIGTLSVLGVCLTVILVIDLLFLFQLPAFYYSRKQGRRG